MECIAFTRNETSAVIIFLINSYKRKNADEDRGIYTLRQELWDGSHTEHLQNVKYLCCFD